MRPARLRALRRGLARRGWLPSLSLSFGVERNRTSIKDHDEAFLSGETRLLDDRERRRAGELDAEITLRWDLGDVAYNPEVVDLSREARQVIALRDDILDEINQLYYERQRVLLKLAAMPGWDAEDSGAVLLRNRADELAAGLDAWTGGWFSAQLRQRSPQPVGDRPARSGGD